ncbi:NAD-dependent epimerase/dehydratase family protein [Micromonospora sp. NBC_01813]|uniref:NAD-dependent epimerase/dehydratase family protein n=1 Tax=Micromonospora sp. NBC_01813 TaxID=2975988 RepID=UPI002DDC1B71|nr:NAD-dependent epimerase/dehydratase family protein [Micromonospora sp. NBC_01813]WSA11088.1 NAD-dependent epimerase/dehydratase family protein [Micromonospora sp. NBC_01813]
MSGRLAGLRVAVTGASGFCGAAVARAAAAAGAEVVSVGRRPGPLGRHVPWDAGRELPDLRGVDAVLHLAAAVGDPAPGPAAEAAYHAVNVAGTVRLLTAAADRPVVWVSSASVYRPGGGRTPIREDDPTDGQRTVYGRTKAAGERLALAGGAVVLRPRAVYGAGDRQLLPRLLAAVRRGRVPLPGADVTMSMTAVENLADACLTALDWPAGPYNVADATPYSRDAVVTGVLAALGRPARPLRVPVPVAVGAAAVAGVAARLGVPGTGRLTRYAVEQLAYPTVLDLSRAFACGWRPRRTMPDFLTELTAEVTRGLPPHQRQHI